MNFSINFGIINGGIYWQKYDRSLIEIYRESKTGNRFLEKHFIDAQTPTFLVKF